MFDRLTRALRRAKPEPAAPTLAARLASYPPYDAPHVGWGRAITLEQAEENLAHLKAVLPQRLAIVGQLLRDDAGIDIEPALAAPLEQGPALASALNRWVGERWPVLHEPRMRFGEDWKFSRREGADIAYSLALDVALVLGELIVRGNPAWRWGVDRDKANLRDGMASARRLVLLADRVGRAPRGFEVDVEAIVVERLCTIDYANAHLTHMDSWRRVVDEAQRGLTWAAYL